MTSFGGGHVVDIATQHPALMTAVVQVPMLIVGATGDTVAPLASDMVRRVANPNLRVIEVDADHFDPCFDPVFPQMVDP